MSSTQNAVSNPIVVPVADASPKGRSFGPFADKALRASAGFWFVVVVLGQLIFAFATASFFGLTAVRGETGRWSRVLTHGVIPLPRNGAPAWRDKIKVDRWLFNV